MNPLPGDTVLVPDDGKWRVRTRTTEAGKFCVYGGMHQCRRPAVLELNRSRPNPKNRSERIDQWWGYCERHTFGRVVLNDGIYFAWSPEEIPDADTA